MKQLFFLAFMVISFACTAQSKKELLAQLQHYQLKEQQWRADSLQWATEKQAMAQTAAQEKNAAQQEIATLQNNQKNLQNQIADCQTLTRRQVEVFDIYSFGYQPFKNSDKEFKAQLKNTLKAIENARWKNIEELAAFLKSKKKTEAEKQMVFDAFSRLYPALKNSINRASFEIFSAETQNIIRQQIAIQTQNELNSAARENLWIQALDGRWTPEELALLLMAVNG